MLWCGTISPLAILELINIFPVFMERYTYHNLNDVTLVTLGIWSIFIRFIFCFIFVDKTGKRLGIIACNRPFPSEKEEKGKEKDKKEAYGNRARRTRGTGTTGSSKKSKVKKPGICYRFFRFIGLLLLQIFYFALPLLPSAAIIVSLHKQNCVPLAHWNHLCMCVYLVLTYLPMLYLLLSGSPGFYTWCSIAVAYACTVWVCLFEPMYLEKWKDFTWE